MDKFSKVFDQAGANPTTDNTGQSGSDKFSQVFNSAGAQDQNTQVPSGNSWDDFKQIATQIANQRGFPSNVLLGQAALESGRGTAAPGNNYFGIKGQGTAGSNNLATQEYGNGGYYGENSNFASYQKPEDSVNAYIDLVMSYPGVPQAVASGDPNQVIAAIENAGYATSPTYVQNVTSTPEFQGGQ